MPGVWLRLWGVEREVHGVRRMVWGAGVGWLETLTAAAKAMAASGPASSGGTKH